MPNHQNDRTNATNTNLTPSASMTGQTPSSMTPSSMTGQTPASSPSKPGGSVSAGSSGTSNSAGSEPGATAQSAERLRQDIARTRSALSEDVAALGERLNPEQLKQDAKEVLHHATQSAKEGAKDLVRDAKSAAVDSLRHAKDHAFESITESVGDLGRRAQRVGHDVSDFVATHAVPLTLVGAGIGWLLVSMSHQRRLASGYDGARDYGDRDEMYYGARDYGSRGYRTGRETAFDEVRDRATSLARRAENVVEQGRDRLNDKAHEVAGRVGELRNQVMNGASHMGERAAEISHRAGERAAEISHRAYESAGRIGHRAYDGVNRAGTRAVELSEENPLATGLLALALGAAAGFMLPSTRRENQLLGATRDRLVERAQRSAHELKSSMQHGAQELRGAIAEAKQTAH